MEKFHLYNLEVFQKYIFYKEKYNTFDLSYPLIISPKVVKSKNKILYVGQETNTWGRKLNDVKNVEILENIYDQFLKSGATNRPYWKFIKNIIETDDLYHNVVWSNLLLCGKKNSLGTPVISEDLILLSAEYLFQVYQAMEPSNVIVTSSTRNPYSIVISAFLQKIGITMMGNPSKEFPLVSDASQKILWTYHPKYLQLSKSTGIVSNQIRKYIR